MKIGIAQTFPQWVKIIYNPPYNTGNDFIYADDFMRSQDEENRQMGMYDEDENRLFKNNDSNGRFHSDWCSMMYSRLMLARNLLTDDGAIFMSIDDNERDNLEKLGAEIFGESNYVATFPWRKRTAKSDVPFGISQDYEWIVCFAKTSKFIARTTGTERKYFETEDYPHRPWRIHDLTTQRTASERPNSAFTMVNPKTGKEYPVNPLRTWAVTKETFAQYYAEGKIVFPDDYPFLNISKPAFRYWKSDDMKKAGEMFGLMPVSTKLPDNIGMSLDGTKEITDIFNGKVFSYPKTVELISFFIDIISKIDKDAIILDFFSGSATSAHAVMRLNAEDGGHRKFIMVQLPEPCDEKSEAYKVGYKTICDIGKERIRRAGDKLYETLKNSGKDFQHIAKNINTAPRKIFAADDGQTSFEVPIIPARWGKADETAENQKLANGLDIGFRVFKLDDTNMKDVYYSAEEYSQTNLEDLESNIKEDRTDLDLLFGCLLDWGLPLSMPYRSEKIDNCTVHTYAPGDAALNVPDALIACFDSNVPETIIKEIAKRRPRRAVFRDSSFASSPEKINVFEIFKLYAPDTDVKVI